MEFDLRTMSRGDRYKILGSCITPRPIAWITSRSLDGHLNVSPFSFFNLIGDNPPVVALGMVPHPERRLKDTAYNIQKTHEFVIHLVDECHAEAMNLTSIDAPVGFDENILAELEMVPSAVVKPPRIASAPASFECRLLHQIETGPLQVAILAEIVFAHVQDKFILDPARLHLDVPAMNLIARLHGGGWYARQTDTFFLQRPEWRAVEQMGGPAAFLAERRNSAAP